MANDNRIPSLIVSAGVGAAVTAAMFVLFKTPCPECPSSENTDRPVTTGHNSPTQSSDPRSSDPGDRARATGQSHVNEALRDQVADLEAENEHLVVRNLENDPRFYGFSESELELLARKCEIRTDSVPNIITENFIKSTGARPDEKEVIERTLLEFKSHEDDLRRKLLIQAGVDIEEYDALDPLGKEALFFSQFTSDDPDNPDRQREIQRVIAEERAGLRTPPRAGEIAESSLYLQFLRHILSEGDRFAEALAAELGNERVHEMRAASGGWPGGGRRLSGCPNE